MRLPTMRVSATANHRLPLASLLALAMAAFITILTEVLPAGLLPQMAQGLAVSEGWVGQTVTIYAIGGLLLERLGVGAFAPALLVLLAAALVVVGAARRHGFPDRDMHVRSQHT